MSGDNRSTLITLTLLLGIVLQVVFVFADSMDSPRKAALEFAQAYYALDPDMAQRLCTTARGEGADDAVAAFIAHQEQLGAQMGFADGFMRSTLIHPKVKTLSKSDAEASVQLIADRKRCLNPVFTWVGKLFHLGTTYEVEEELSLVKEDGRWKVCGAPFELGDRSI